MLTDSPSITEPKFSKELIDQQLERIFLDPFFLNSDILKRFLSFIVEQTLQGHANWLKEYTIGINVLNKPINFKPQENSIVRIHAARLRRALNHYYYGNGAQDPVRISVPIGSYVPVFSEKDKKTKARASQRERKAIGSRNVGFQIEKPGVVAVIPFWYLQNDPLGSSLRDGLGMQLSNALMQYENLSVIAYCTLCNLGEQLTDIEKIASFVGAHYIVTGNIQSQKNRFRIHIQMIHTPTRQQLWSRMYEGKFVLQNIFELQDEIVKSFIVDLNESRKLINEKVQSGSMVAVA
jgi:TolB-like protein